jgi:hypothetical protein
VSDDFGRNTLIPEHLEEYSDSNVIRLHDTPFIDKQEELLTA